MTPSVSTSWQFDLADRLSADRSELCVEQFVDGDQLAAGAGAAGSESPGGSVAVVAPLFGEVGVPLAAERIWSSSAWRGCSGSR